MNLFKSLFLGSAAGLVAVAGAQAADLPMAEPVEYVKVCDTYGSGFFYLPGTETCLKVGGRVRVEAVYSEPVSDRDNKLNFRSRLYVRTDARTATEYGLLRSYISLYATNDGQGINTAGSGLVEYAMIQFAGLTVGYTDSMFDFKPYPSYAGMLVSDIQTTVFAYTAQFGDGFSATIAAEDSRSRALDFDDAPYTSYGNINDPTSSTQTMPDFVANLRVEQGWGEAQISAAVHQINPDNGRDFEYGWAVQGGVQVNLPMIAEDDFIYVSGAYAEGANSYLLSGAGVGQGGNNDLFKGIPTEDFTYNANGKVGLTTGFNVNGGFEHHWSPNWKSSISASYANMDFKNNGFFNGQQKPDWSMVQVAGQTVWTPVKNLDIGVEVVYSRLTDVPHIGGGHQERFATPDNWSGRLRVQRDF